MTRRFATQLEKSQTAKRQAHQEQHQQTGQSYNH